MKPVNLDFFSLQNRTWCSPNSWITPCTGEAPPPPASASSFFPSVLKWSEDERCRQEAYGSGRVLTGGPSEPEEAERLLNSEQVNQRIKFWRFGPGSVSHLNPNGSVHIRSDPVQPGVLEYLNNLHLTSFTCSGRTELLSSPYMEVKSAHLWSPTLNRTKTRIRTRFCRRTALKGVLCQTVSKISHEPLDTFYWNNQRRKVRKWFSPDQDGCQRQVSRHWAELCGSNWESLLTSDLTSLLLCWF